MNKLVAFVALFALVAPPSLDARAARWHPPLLPGRAQLRKPRDMQQRKMFLALTGHSAGWSGHIVDHVVPLHRGGIDAWWNMQWQTIAEAKAKDRLERQL